MVQSGAASGNLRNFLLSYIIDLEHSKIKELVDFKERSKVSENHAHLEIQEPCAFIDLRV